MQALLVRHADPTAPGNNAGNNAGNNGRKELHLFDSFEGLPVGDSDHDPLCYAQAGGAMSASPEDVQANFAACDLPPATGVHVGWFKDSCPEHLPDVVSFAHLDGEELCKRMRWLDGRMDGWTIDCAYMYERCTNANPSGTRDSGSRSHLASSNFLTDIVWLSTNH